MLLFADDLKKRNQVTASFLKAQASFGLGDEQYGSQLLSEVLKLDHSHRATVDLQTELQVWTALARQTHV